MRKSNEVIVLGVLIFGTIMVQAQINRTWVSGTGNDANPCSRTAPCRTFAGAISKTAAGGEIDALDSGDFGAVTITKAITIDSGGTQIASVMANGTNGIVVQAGPNDVVILRNLRINGIGTGINGIRFLSGKDLNVENSYIFGFTTNGIDVVLNQRTQASVHVLSSVIKNVGGVGIRATNAVTPDVQVGVEETSVILTSIGVQAADHSYVAVDRSFVENAGTAAYSATSSAGDSIMTVDHSDGSFSGIGVQAINGSQVFIADSKFASNTTQVSLSVNGGGCVTYGSNRFYNPTLPAGLCTAASPAQQ